jgi:hypothetical protein
MKTTSAIGLVAAAIAVTVAIEESRIASLRSATHIGETTAASLPSPATAVSPTDAAVEENGAPARTKKWSEVDRQAAAKDAIKSEALDDSLAKTARKMWENPAGKSMMNQGIKIAVAMMYQDYMDSLDLTKEEAEYFKTLLGKPMAHQQELGMKMLNASEEERTKLTEEIASLSKQNEEDIKKFLNNDKDFQSYKNYKDRLPERQQLDGIRTTLASKGAPLDEETEAKLVEAMHHARTTTQAPDMSGPDAMKNLADGNLTASFEANWESQQEALRRETAGILNETQQAAFQEYQKQLKDMQLMSLKMAEKMMSDKKPASE